MLVSAPPPQKKVHLFLDSLDQRRLRIVITVQYYAKRLFFCFFAAKRALHPTFLLQKKHRESQRCAAWSASFPVFNLRPVIIYWKLSNRFLAFNEIL